MKTKMNSNTAAKATERRLPLSSTPGNLEMNFSTVLTFGGHTLVAGHFYNPSGKCYFGAVYALTTGDHTCEGEVRLVSTSEELFEDNGHAIAWAMANSMKYEIKTSMPDPFDLACSDCEVHYMECWEEISVEELRQLHAEQLADDANTPDWEIEEMKANGGWNPTIPDFEMWLRQGILDGCIRTKA